MREHFVLRHDRSGGVLRDHQSGVDAGSRGEIRRQAAIVIAVEHCLGATFGDVRKLGDCDRQEVGGERERLTVKVSGGVGEAMIAAIRRRPVVAKLQIDRIAAVRKEKRIVGRGVDLALGDRPNECDRIARRAVHLRRTSQRIRILHRAGTFNEATARE